MTCHLCDGDRNECDCWEFEGEYDADIPEDELTMHQRNLNKETVN